MKEKKVLVAGFHIVWATDHCINRDAQSILVSLTSFSLAKAYYFFVSTRTFRLLVLLLSSQTLDFANNYGQGRKL